MKFGRMLLIGLLLISTSAFGALNTADVDKIRGIVKESEERLRTEISLVREEVVSVEERLRAEMALMREQNAATEKQLRAEITASEKRNQEHTSQEVGKVMIQVDETNKREDRNFLLLLTFIAVIIGLPQIIAALQRRGERAQNTKLESQQKQLEMQQRNARAQDAKIAAQQKQIDVLNRELETLKQQKS